MNSFELKRLSFTLLGIAMFLTAQAQLSFTSPTTLFVMHSSGNHLMMATDYGGQLEAANAANAQQMTIVPDGNGYYYIRAKDQRYLSKEYKSEVERWGYIDPARWNAFYGWINENGLFEAVIPDNTGFTNDYLE